MTKQKSLVLVSHNIMKNDGQGRVNFELAKNFIKAGYELILIANVVDPELIKEGAVWQKISVPKSPILIKTLLFAFWANNIVSKINADIIVANGFVLTKKHHINISHFVHSAWLASPYFPKLNLNLNSIYQYICTALNARWEKKSYNNSECIVAVSEIVKKDLVEAGISPRKISIITNGVDCIEFYPDSNKQNLPKKKILFIGDIKTNRKNVLSVIGAIPYLPKNISLVIVGDIQESPFPKMVEQMGLKTRVKFYGFRKDIPSIMKDCDLFVFPSFYEACPLVVNEALASGLPVITASKVGNEKITVGAGIAIKDPMDKYELAKAVTRILTDDQLWHKMSKQARVNALQNTWEIMFSKYNKLINNTTRTFEK